MTEQKENIAKIKQIRKKDTKQIQSTKMKRKKIATKTSSRKIEPIPRLLRKTNKQT